MTRGTAAGPAELAEELSARGIQGFELAFVLGSGLGAFAERLEDARSVAFSELEAMPESAVPGHAGRFVLGRLSGVSVLAQSGRVHLYEGWSVGEVTRAVRAFAVLGCRDLVLTNAAGGLVAGWPVPCLMRIADHLNLQGRTPLSAREAGRGTPYDAELAAALDAAAREEGIELRSGVYAGLLGPTYETPAEVRWLASIGAQAVGMSTVAEALAGHAAGMRVAAVSCITNPAAGIAEGPLDHGEVVEAGRAMAADFQRLLCAFVTHASASGG